jgi:hypothetical protein
MTRCLVLSLGLAALTGCYDFKGDRGALGFSSNLHTAPGRSWTPDAPIASGTRGEFIASERLDSGSERPDVTGSFDGELLSALVRDLVDEDGVPRSSAMAVTAKRRGRGTVRYDGEVADQFDVEFAPLDQVVLERADALLDQDAGIAASDWAIVPGKTRSLWPTLLAADGRPLGYRLPDLDASADGSLSAWQDASGVIRVVAEGEPGEDGEVLVQLRDRTVQRVPFVLADPSEIVSLQLVPLSFSDDTGETAVVVVAVGWLDDDTRLIGLDVEWTWSGGPGVRRVTEAEDPDGFIDPERLALLDADRLQQLLHVRASVGGHTASIDVPSSMD